MTKHKPGVSKYEKEYRRILEHNKKAIKEQHIDEKKISKQIGEHFREITAKFSDKEMEEASEIGMFIINKYEPEVGFSYEEIASVMWGMHNAGNDGKDWKKFEEAMPEEYLKDNTYISKVDRLLYVLKCMIYEFTFNTTKEGWEKDKEKRCIPILPCVRPTKQVKNLDGTITAFDEPIPMIFNGVKMKYRSEDLIKFGEVVEARSYTENDIKTESIIGNLKGNYETEVNSKEFIRIAENIRRIIHESKDIEETELLHKVLPGSIGKSGKELDPYWIVLNDALYLIFESQGSGNNEANEQWKLDHGYLEGR
jgi:hypothetical protein